MYALLVPCIKAYKHEGFCYRSMLQAHFSAHEGVFSSSLNLPRERAPKYLTGEISWSILRGGNSAPKDDVYPWNRWYTRRSFAPAACPWSMLREQNPSCVSAFTVSIYLCQWMQTSLLTPYHSQANCIYATANKIVELNMSLVYCVVQSSFYDLQQEPISRSV